MQKGFIAFSSVLIISAVVLAVTISVTFLGIGEGQSSLALTKGENTLDLVEGCMEDALLNLRANALYTGGSIEDTCTISINKVNNTAYIVTATTTDTSYIRTIRATITRDYSETIISWIEQ